MRVAFPYPVRLQSSLLRLDGQRLGQFTNIDGEAFARPALNGFWRLDMTLVALDQQAQLALSGFVTDMSGNARCVVPICTLWRPNDADGRPLTRGGVAPEYTLDHVGFANDPFPGFTLLASASHRDSFIDVAKPALSHLVPGMFITIGERLHQVGKVSAIGESETAIRVSIKPPIRGNHDAGTLVVVDQLKLLCTMESGDQIGVDTSPIKTARLSFVEAFGDLPQDTGAPPPLEPLPDTETPATPFDFVAFYEAQKVAATPPPPDPDPDPEPDPDPPVSTISAATTITSTTIIAGAA